VVDASKTSADLVERNLLKTVPVIDVQNITSIPMVARELVLVKVQVDNTTARGELKTVADMFGGNVVDVSKDTIIIEVTGEETKIDSLLKIVHEYGIKEVVRTGRVAMTRG
jgi:acetolactate synthase I/III small subunit